MQPIVVIGLDAFDPDLLERWCDEGHLPFLASLRAEGASTRIHSRADLFYAPVWLSFSTGVSPGRHGFYHVHHLDDAGRSVVPLDPERCRYPPFWAHVSDPTTELAVLDVPKTPLAESVTGVQVAGWGEFHPTREAWSRPPEALREIRRRFGSYPLQRVRFAVESDADLHLFHRMLEGIARKTEASRHLLERRPGLLLTVFAEPHLAGHQLLHHADPGHWAHDPQAPPELFTALREVYARLDSALAELHRSAPEDATFLVVSLHGIRANFSGDALLSEVLTRLGFQAVRERGRDAGHGGAGGMLTRLRSRVPAGAREWVNETLLPEAVQRRLVSRLYLGGLDWSRTRAFRLPSGEQQSYLRLNVAGREPHGTVEPGAARDALCAEIRAELARLVDPETGSPVVREVVEVAEVHRGEGLRELPDLVVKWVEGRPITAVSHPGFGVVTGGRSQPYKAQHAPDGFLIASGRGIDREARLPEADCLDLAPTLLRLLGEEVPDYMEGRVLTELLGEA